jgi:hypothetical protein
MSDDDADNCFVWILEMQALVEGSRWLYMLGRFHSKMPLLICKLGSPEHETAPSVRMPVSRMEACIHNSLTWA